MAELALDRLTLRFGGLTVLDGVSLAVEAGELFALIGPNGAGKTSVLNCVSGIYHGEGAIRVRGNDISGRAPHEIARLGLARTFQHGELFAQMSVLDNLLTGRHARIRTNPLAEMLFLPGVRREEMRHREAVERIIEFVELERYRHAPVAGLPFGIQKLVGFARALALEPTILMLDEPSLGLAPRLVNQILEIILKLAETGVSILLVEQNVNFALEICDYAYVLENGVCTMSGPGAKLLADPQLREAYLPKV